MFPDTLWMVRFLIQIAANALGILVASLAVPGFVFSGDLKTLILAGLVLALANAVIRPLLKLLSLPLILITFGLFLVVVNMIVLKIVDYLIDSLRIAGVWALFWGTLIVSIVSSISMAFVKKKENV